MTKLQLRKIIYEVVDEEQNKIILPWYKSDGLKYEIYNCYEVEIEELQNFVKEKLIELAEKLRFVETELRYLGKNDAQTITRKALRQTIKKIINIYEKTGNKYREI